VTDQISSIGSIEQDAMHH